MTTFGRFLQYYDNISLTRGDTSKGTHIAHFYRSRRLHLGSTGKSASWIDLASSLASRANVADLTIMRLKKQVEGKGHLRRTF